MVCARWEDDKGWTEIHSEREWKEMMERAYAILVPEDNWDLPYRLIIVVPKKSIVSRLQIY